MPSPVSPLRRLDGAPLLPLIRAGIVFVDGVQQEGTGGSVRDLLPRLILDGQVNHRRRMPDSASNSDISKHILPTSATMVGVSITVVSLVRLLEVHAGIETIIDDVAAVAAVTLLLGSVTPHEFALGRSSRGC
jgi:hypothetical protein